MSILRVTGAVACWDARSGDHADDLFCDLNTGTFQATTTADYYDVLDASDCIITPGLVNAHHHLLQSAFRSLPGSRGVPMREWLGVMGAAYRRTGVDPELAAAAASVGLAESLLRGVTTVADHHLTWPALPGSDDVALARAVASAARDLGVRLVFVRGSAGDDPARAAASAEAIVAALLGSPPHSGPTAGGPTAGGPTAGGPTAGGPTAGGPTAGRTAAPGTAADGPAAGGAAVRGPVAHGGGAGGVSADGMLQVAVGPAGVHSDSEETFKLLGEVAARHGLRRRTQANEQVDVAIALERYGRRPLDLLEDWGWLAPDVTIAHLCEITPDELRRIAASGASATHAPGCDLPMGWGVAPAAALADAGVALGLGTSGGGSNDAGHLLADARLAMQVAPLAGRPVTAREVLGWATTGAATGLGRSELGRPELGRPELGSLAPGSAADLVCWPVDGVADAGVADRVGGLLWADPGRRPRHVVVGGRVVVRDGELVTADAPRIAHDLTALLNRRAGRVSTAPP